MLTSDQCSVKTTAERGGSSASSILKAAAVDERRVDKSDLINATHSEKI